MPTLTSLSALEILDSRGRPTIEVSCTLSSGAAASAQVPSGASTGGAEAAELRDGDAARYAGLGCRQAVRNVISVGEKLTGAVFESQGALDGQLIALDGTPNKSKLGANAILGISLAFARASAVQAGVPLYDHFAAMIGHSIRTLPRLTVNLFSGGKHAGGQVSIQDVLIVPASARSVADSLVDVTAVYRSAATLINGRYGMRNLTADEGGLAPPCDHPMDLITDASDAISAAGLAPGNDVALALDVAASHFYTGSDSGPGAYRLAAEPIDGSAMVDAVCAWVDRFPIVSVEDGLAEEDWDHWQMLLARLRGRALVLGDDLLCTNPARIRRAIADNACDALLLKVNQIGTLTEAAEALSLARDAGWRVTISARSGETEDNWLADLAVGWGADQIKVGSITQSERLAKYNRLLAIEAATGLPVVAWPN
jgi:enolase